MDLNKLFATGTATIELIHPVTGDVLMDESTPPKPMSLTIMGKHTSEYKKLEREVGFAAMKRTKKQNFDKMSFEEFSEAASQNDEATIDLRAKMVVGCNIFMDGKQLKHSHKNILDLLSDERCSWLKLQLEEELEKSNLFFKS